MANINDKFGRASLSTDYAQATTVKTTRTPGESVLAAFDLSKFATDTPVYFLTYRKVIDPTTGEVSITNQTSWKALVNSDNNTLTNLTLAPGYVDMGNQVGDYIEPSPTSYWGNSLVEGLRTSLNPDGSLLASTVIQMVYPVGSLYFNATNNANPSSLLGFGTWVAFGAGRVPVGFNASDSSFNSAEKTGGAKTHTLTVNEMPSHNHSVDVGFTLDAPVSWNYANEPGNTINRGTTRNSANRGGGQAHNNLQPYITVYMWKRTA